MKKRVEDYTVLDLIKKYKYIIGNEIEEVASFILPKKTVTLVTKQRMQQENVKPFSKQYKDLINELGKAKYQTVEEQLKANNELNNSEKCKRKVLTEVYMKFSYRMKSEQELAELKELMIGEEQEYIFFETFRDDDIPEYEIITKEKNETLEGIKDEELKRLINRSFESIQRPEELMAMIKDRYPKEISSIILRKVMFDLIKQKNIVFEGEFKQFLNSNNIEKVLGEHGKEYKDRVIEFFKSNLQFLDKRKILLNFADIVMSEIEDIKNNEFENIELQDITIDVKETIIKNDIQILREIYNRLILEEDVTFRIIYQDEEIVSVSRAKIEEFLGRCIDSEYLTEEEICKIHDTIANGEFITDKAKIKIANIDIQDLINLSGNYAKKENDEDKSKLLYCAVELAEYLKTEGLTTNKKLLNLYLDGEIGLDIIKNIDMPEITPEAYNQKFKLIYDRILYAFSEEEKKEEQQKLSRLAELYKHLETEGKTNIDDLIANLITAYGEDYGTDVMYDLYNLKMVSIETAVGWIGDDILLKICKKDGLPPEKIRQLFENEIIEIDSIAKIVNTLLDDTSEKTMFIGIIFSNDEENWTELVKRCIKIEKGAKEQIENSVERKHKQGPIYTEHVIEAFERTRKISSIDDEYYVETGIVDGHVIAHLPKFQKVIIEKMFDRKGNTAHDAATYRLSKKYFEENRDRIIENGKVHRKVLFEDYKREDISTEDIDRKIHNIKTWGKGIDEWFGIESESRWNEDELKDAEEKGKDKRKQVGENK